MSALTGMSEAVSLIGVHERTAADMVEEGLGVPAEGALLLYRDAARERRVGLLFPDAESARARADALVRSGRARRREVRVLSLAEALRR